MDSPTTDRKESRRKAMRLLSVLTVCAVGALALAGCTPSFVKGDQSEVILVITKIVGVAGAGPDADQESDFLLSDVVTGGGVINDNATLTFRLDAKNPTLLTPGTFNDVMLERYEVTFTRSDGQNVQGVDVPYAFSGPMATRVLIGGGETGASIVLVRHQAKREPPLRNMWGAGGLEIVSMTANITVHGRTVNGRAVTASGRLQVGFADFADE